LTVSKRERRRERSTSGHFIPTGTLAEGQSGRSTGTDRRTRDRL